MKKRNLLILIFAIVLCACFIGCGGCGEIDPINIEDDNITIKRIGDTYQLTTTGGDDNKVWASLDTSIATVSDTGLVTAVANGITEVTVTSANVTDVCVINVKQAVLPEPGLMVSFSKSAVVLNGFSKETYTVETIVTKNNQEVEADLTWTNSDTEGEYITFENGVITAKANTPIGEPVVITCRATYGEEWAEANLYVTVEDDTDITFLTSQTLFYYASEAPENITIPVKAKINGMDTAEPIVLSTSNVGIAKIENNEIKLVAAGDVIIYATVNNKTKGYPIHVRAKYFIDDADELKAISQGSDDVAYELRNDITVETADFIRENIGGTDTKTTAVYLIETFKGELFGEGYKITYNYNVGYYGEFTDETFRGLFKQTETTAKIKDTVFVANLRLDHPHMYSFVYQNYGTIESCFVYSNRRQVAAGTGYQDHYNTAGGVFYNNAGIVKDTIIVGNFFKGEHETTSIGDNLVMGGSKNSGKFDNVAFISARNAIGNHRNANWNGAGAMGRDELTNLVHYTDMTAFANLDGNKITNPTDDSEYAADKTNDQGVLENNGTYKRTATNENVLSEKWDVETNNIKLGNRDAWIKASVSLDRKSIDFIPSESETVQITATTDHADTEFDYKSEDTDVATVNANGIVSRVGKGRTRIVATHKVSGEQRAVMIAVLEAKAISSKAEFMALKDADNLTYAYLTSDLTLTTEDASRLSVTSISESFVPTLKAYFDGKGHKITVDYVSHKIDVEQEVTGEDGATTTEVVQKDSNFIGVFGTVDGNITNVAIQGFIENIEDSAVIIANTLNASGKVDNCFVNVDMTQARSGKYNAETGKWTNQNWTSMLKIIGTNNGAVSNSILKANSSDNNRTNGVPLQSHGSGTWTNVAQVGVSFGGAYYNRGAAAATNKVRANQMSGVAYYTSLENVISGNGKQVDVVETRDDNEKLTNITLDVSTALSEVQSFPSVWSIDNQGIKINDKYVWKSVELTASTDELNFVESISESATISVYADSVLTTDVQFTSSDESVATVSSTGEVTAVSIGSTKIRVVHSSGNFITIKVNVKESKAIATKADFLALGELDPSIYAYLTTDITLTTEDAKIIPATTGTTVYGAFVEKFDATLDGNGYKINYTYDMTQADSVTRFAGIFVTVNGTLSNLVVDADISGVSNYSYVVATAFNSTAKLENSYIKSSFALGTATTDQRVAFIGSQFGKVENCILEGVQTKGTVTAGISLQLYEKTGSWNNVALVGPTLVRSYSNRGAGTYITGALLNNVAYYTSMTNFVAGIGQDWTTEKDGDTWTTTNVLTDLTEPQDLGSAWVVDNTEYSENVKLNDKTIWQAEWITLDVTDEADFIAKMNSATEFTVLRLTEDLDFDTSHFIREPNNSTTSVRTYDVYLIKSFKGVLLGNGKKITWELKPENVGDRTVCDSAVYGVFKTLESTGKLDGCYFQGETYIPDDGATGFMEVLLGTIEDCFIDIQLKMGGSNRGNWLATTGVFGRNGGLMKNTVVKSVGYTSITSTSNPKGLKLIHNGTSNNTGTFEGVALVQPAKSIGTTNNANEAYIYDRMLVDLVYYSSLDNLISATGERVRNDGNDATFEYTAITEAQDLGSAWTIDATGIKLNGIYVYTVA